MTRDNLSRLVRAGLLTGIIDGLFPSLGREALEGGVSTALVGVLMHFGAAFGSIGREGD